MENITIVVPNLTLHFEYEKGRYGLTESHFAHFIELAEDPEKDKTDMRLLFNKLSDYISSPQCRLLITKDNGVYCKTKTITLRKYCQVEDCAHYAKFGYDLCVECSDSIESFKLIT